MKQKTTFILYYISDKKYYIQKNNRDGNTMLGMLSTENSTNGNWGRNKPTQDSTNEMMGRKPLSTEDTNDNSMPLKMSPIADSTFLNIMPETP